METGILSEYTAMEEVSPDVALGAVLDEGPPAVAAFDPVLAIKMKGLDRRIKQEERETLLIQLRVIEAETDRDLKLRQ